VSEQALVDEIAATFERTWHRLGVSYDQFIRTTQPSHRAGVRALIEQILDRNPDDLYEKSYEGWYCVGCELFKTESEIVDGHCVLHPTRVLEWTTERNWFFRLTRYATFLKSLLDEEPYFLRPESRRNEILGLLESGLEDVSVTRARLTWAIPFPRPTSDGEAQGTWVWFDALPNYLTATGYPASGYERRWPADLHIVGKDITRLHCVIWPAMLESAGLRLPRQVWAHGFMSLNGQRFSKSAGVWLDLDEAVNRYGADALRYYLLREMPFDGDGDFSWARFDARYTADLANAFGNLASRTVAMVERYCGGVVPAGELNDVDAADAADYALYHAAIGGPRGYLLSVALQHVWNTVARANEYVDRQAPWKLAKDPGRRAELEATLSSLVRQLARQAVALAPFIPTKSEELWVQLGAPGSVHDQRFAAHAALDGAGWRVAKGAPLFPRAIATP
jgi:methionyl-tRNA synthetase